MELWGSDECIKKSEINTKNRRAGHENAAGTHTGGYISMGEYRKKLVFMSQRIYALLVSLSSATHLTFNRVLIFYLILHFIDGLFFNCLAVAIIKILREKTLSQGDIDQCEAFYQAVGGEKKRRIYGLGSEAKSYYRQKLSALSSVLPSISQSTPITTMDEFVKQMFHALTNHFLPIVMGRVQEGSTPIDNPSIVTPLVPPSATTNEDEVDH
ncbi:hypothetical protein R3W88_020189 [Solanum pinnatisectum]|uniref:Uncharacterized protein n=1 Tax=Solanum pinnatisectum TaxID=50273 RepID=A0AAV9KQN2_9SOLN|nr:hypothetical protein R3W88_020189 [Solanum pinnatisectum]